jgi:hypothetical protein
MVLIIFQVPHEVQQIMSGQKTPLLSGAIPALEMFMSEWEELAETCPRLKPFIDEGLDSATKYYRRMDHTNAYIIAMCEYYHQFLLYFFSTASSLLVINPSIRLT